VGPRRMAKACATPGGLCHTDTLLYRMRGPLGTDPSPPLRRDGLHYPSLQAQASGGLFAVHQRLEVDDLGLPGTSFPPSYLPAQGSGGLAELQAEFAEGLLSLA
jgi:hypothetical protein